MSPRRATAVFACSLVVTTVLRAQEMTVAEATVVLEGRIVDQRGEPVPAAEVRVAGSRAPEAVLRRVFADGDGTFRAVVARHDWHRLEVHGKGYAPRRLRIEDASWTEVRLQEAAPLRVRVLDAESKPVPGTEVFAQPTEWMPDAWCSAVTDDTGIATLAEVAVGPQRILTWIPGFGLAANTVDVHAAAEAMVDPFTMPSTTLRVRVGLPTDASANEVHPVLWLGGNAATAIRPRITWRREENVFLLDHVPALPFHVELVAPDHTVVPRSTDLERDKGPYTAHFLCEPTREWVYTAVVRDRDGKPIPGIRLRMSSVDGDETAEATSAADGLARFATRLGPGETYRIVHEDPRWTFPAGFGQGSSHQASYSVRGQLHGRLEPGVAIEARMRNAATIRGQVLDPAGRPAPNAFVALEVELPRDPVLYLPQMTTRTAADGSFEFAGLDPMCRAVRLRASTGSDAAVTDRFEIPDPDGPGAGEQRLRLAPAATVEGVVQDPDGKPYVGTQLQLVEGGKEEAPTEHTPVLTDHLGRYRFTGVTSGQVTLRILSDEFVFETGAPFAVRAGTNPHDVVVKALLHKR